METEMLVGLWSGASQPSAWHSREKAGDFFDIKGIVEGLIGALGVAGVSFTALPDERCRYTRSGHTARIDLEGQMLGVVGEVSAGVNGRYGLKQPAFIFELSLEPLMRSISDARQMTPIPRFPSISRDVTVIIDAVIESRRLLDAVARFDEPLVRDLELFDVFAGDPIPPQKKSVSFRVVYQADDRTLEDEAVNTIHRQLTHRLVREFDAALPA
jgi:phenylalanyl-tRNA synthetase beta chain